MSSQYALYEINKISRQFAPEAGVPKGVRLHYNITPTQSVPVIVVRDGARRIEIMNWGFVPVGAKDNNSVFRYKTYNARAEMVFSKPTWSKVIRTQRCLIPANGFYEFKKSSSGQDAYYISVTDQPIFAFAGVYSVWTDIKGVERGMCSIITVDSDTNSDSIPGRLPVIVRLDDQADWLNPEIENAATIYKMMKVYDISKLKIIRVSDDVKLAKNDKPYLIERFTK